MAIGASRAPGSVPVHHASSNDNIALREAFDRSHGEDVLIRSGPWRYTRSARITANCRSPCAHCLDLSSPSGFTIHFKAWGID